MAQTPGMNVVVAASVEKKGGFLLSLFVAIAHLLHSVDTVAVAMFGSSWLRPHGSARRNRDADAACTEVQVAATWEGSTAAAAQAAACAAAQAAACTEEAQGIHAQQLH